jgi:sensor domain CHASE-containing protein
MVTHCYTLEGLHRSHPSVYVDPTKLDGPDQLMVLFPHNTLETVISFENLPQLQFPPKKSNPIEREREMADVEETELSGKQKKEIAKWFLLNSPAGEIQYVAKGNAPLSLSLSLSPSKFCSLFFFFFQKKN